MFTIVHIFQHELKHNANLIKSLTEWRTEDEERERENAHIKNVNEKQNSKRFSPFSFSVFFFSLCVGIHHDTNWHWNGPLFYFKCLDKFNSRIYEAVISHHYNISIYKKKINEKEIIIIMMMFVCLLLIVRVELCRLCVCIILEMNENAYNCGHCSYSL